ncbi:MULTISPECIES: Asp-tRNA(Asn)/Glu-tRNA(Gln) amidotransferase subunit GatC [unclassified Endozoicomonas]|uniref:Asp-tRNA(Asn)/Glu-tRNA(Gln) amidotransferase subunit GatC n=1 Tax=unclassified Endozoicomonas TaxID=2644528 RepID=UPI002148575E|nr:MULTISPECIES: Asp-tRNA(Asn)/Glu-tRNA(Gln) amidotransferase subunit GatC [unclassified Endozoicomonas]
MAVDASEIQKVANLARLSIDESQLETTADTINRILELVDQMQMVKTDHVEPLAHPLDATQRLRKDVVSEENNREQLQSCAPVVEDGLFLVPKVIE